MFLYISYRTFLICITKIYIILMISTYSTQYFNSISKIVYKYGKNSENKLIIVVLPFVNE